ncbi:alpha/beta hydrolase [Pacificimonas sp. WHA3]|uniref:Alpha/beta hydrolase n=1 Tax=Pacificimonas pallii TaxID=2827236 RepID=A0ABS6SFT5_9SPHN|nr:alpha/beta hydrolase [Pacificimonas pallii]MBV7257278.1 alpha/beta hydrolase [Pacificimonas pallii]
MTKPPLFFIHGMWSTPKVWDGMRAHFEARGHVVHVPHLPFHERDADNRRDDAPDRLLSTTGVQDYVDALIASARDVGEPPVIIGHSMGGMLAQKLAEAIGARGLILLSPAPTASTGSLAIAPLRTTFGLTSNVRGKWWKSPTMIDEERARWGIFNEVPAKETEEAIADLVWDSGRVLYQISMPWADKSKATHVDYEKLDMPALVVVGDVDRITPVATARATVRKLSGEVDYVELDGVGHWLFHDPVAGRVTSAMDNFLNMLGG